MSRSANRRAGKPAMIRLATIVTILSLFAQAGVTAAAPSDSAAMASETVAAPTTTALAQCRAPVQIALKPDWATPRTVFRGWGTNLAWFASTTGTWPDPIRKHLADLLFGADGLGFNVARYNIGGGRKPGTQPLSRANANIPGMWKQPSGARGNDWWRADDPSMWDWSADAGQQWWLDAVRERVPQEYLMLEATSYSPPWFMTVSDDVAGAKEKYQPNLRPGFEKQYAEYLVRAMQGLEKIHGVQFHSLSPMNEPNTPQWVAGNRREGNFMDSDGQSRMLIATAQALQAHGATALLSAMDETNPATFVTDWAAYSSQARSVVQQLNVHGYSTTGETGVRDVASVSKRPIWMSEVDLSAPMTVQDFNDPISALLLGEQIVLDLKRLEPEAWVIWQATEPSALPGDPGSNWGLIRTDMSVMKPTDMSLHVTAKYYAMASFSRHLRPGYRLVRNNDPDTVTAVSPDGARAVIIHVNHGFNARKIDIATQGLEGAGWKVADQLVNNAVTPVICDGRVASVVAPPRAITTIELEHPY